MDDRVHSAHLLDDDGRLGRPASAHALLERVVALALDAIVGCEAASAFVIDERRRSSPALVGPLASEGVRLQHTAGEAPALDVIAGCGVVSSDDLATEPRWPTFAQRAVAAGIRSIVALELSDGDQVGVLCLYASCPRAFAAADRARAAALASVAGVAIANVQRNDAGEHQLGLELERSTQLHDALATREVIGQAQGILMEREHVSAAEAFAILRRASQQGNRKLRVVAQHLVDTGECPDAGEPSPAPGPA